MSAPGAPRRREDDETEDGIRRGWSPWRRLASPPWVAAAAALLGAGAMALSFVRRPPQTEWGALALWGASVLLFASACRPAKASSPAPLAGRRAELAATLALLVTVGCALLLPRLEVYPLDVAGDPVRDSGLYPRSVLCGERTQIFDYGPYLSHTQVFSAAATPFYLLFGPSSLSFKAMAAAIGLITPVLLYGLARRRLPFAAALLAALLLFALPVYLFYCRREPLCALSALWMVVLMAAVLGALDNELAPRTLALLGLTVGVAMHLHAAAKVAAFASLALVGCLAVVGGARAWVARDRRCAARFLLLAPGAALAGWTIGIGPTLLHADLGGLASAGRLAPGLDLATLLDNYQRSLRVYFDQPATTWFPLHRPLIPPPALTGAFALGAAFGHLVAPRRLYGLALAYLLVLPLTNSALTDTINADHRLTPLLPVIALTMALGMAVAWRALSRMPWRVARRLGRGALAAGVAWAAVAPVYGFFADEEGRHRGNVAQHLMHFALREIHRTPGLAAAQRICVGASPALRHELELMHFREAWRYHLPDREVQTVAMRGDAGPDELFLSTSCATTGDRERWSARTFCAPRRRYVCPGEETGVGALKVWVHRPDLAAGRRPLPRLLLGLALLSGGSACEMPRRAVAPEQEAPPLAAGEIRVQPGGPESGTTSPPGRPSLLAGTETPWTSGSAAGLVRLELAAALSSGAVVLTANDADFQRRSAAIADGDPETLARSEGTNPLVVTLAFGTPIRLRAVRVFLAGSPYDWSVEPGPGGERYLARHVPERTWSQIPWPAAKDSDQVRLEFLRLERDDFVHVNELELYVEP